MKMRHMLFQPAVVCYLSTLQNNFRLKIARVSFLRVEMTRFPPYFCNSEFVLIYHIQMILAAELIAWETQGDQSVTHDQFTQ